MPEGPVLVWLRHDLRLDDHPALVAAAETGRPVLPVYILDELGPWAPGGASRWWLHGSLEALARQIARIDGRLILRRGDAPQILRALVEETGARAVLWNRCYDAHSVARDTTLKAEFAAQGIEARSFNGSLLYEPWTVRNKAGRPYQVFTQFWRACREMPPTRPLPAPTQLASPSILPPSDRLEDWSLRPTRPDWAQGLRETWSPGADAAERRQADFLSDALSGYGARRDQPAEPGTSRLSPHLHFGEISPRRIWQSVVDHLAATPHPADSDTERFLAELGWREFSYSLLHYNADLPSTPLRPEFQDFPWGPDASLLRAWQRGETGYPIVDAGMRELWATGWMHNRVRMITASFLVKHLLQPWQAGAAWFWDTLVDADLANNSASWQWVAGCGADAAPYFRIFNPVLQGQKFDPAGTYVRHWVPELAHLPDDRIHQPWTGTLAAAYPRPVIDLAFGRARALAAYGSLKTGH